MKFTTLLLTLAATAIASPNGADIAGREDKPDASCCCCDLTRPGYVCKPPTPEGCEPCATVLCPWDPATEEQCCCCGPDDVKCKTIKKGDGCACPKIACGVDFEYDWLPKPAA